MKNRFSVLKSKTAKSAAFVSGLLATGLANAQVDAAQLAAEVETGSSAVETVGIAVLSVLATVCVLKLMRRAF